MSTLISSLADNLPEIYNKEWRECQKRKIKSVCDFIELKNNKLHYNCKDS